MPRKPVSPQHNWVGASTSFLDERSASVAVRNGWVKIDVDTVVDVLEVYCLAGETEFITRDGIRRLGDCADTTQLVLSQHFGEHDRTRSRADGRWVEAEIRSFGEQPLLAVTLTRNSVRKVIRATPNHRWFASRSNSGQATPRIRLTSELRPGEVLASLTPRTATRQSLPSPFGIAHGIVFGDGSRKMNRGTHDGCIVDLWGEKDLALLPYFNGSPTAPMKLPTGVEGVRVKHLPNAFKAPPDLGESVPYLYGWLAGYFAADGSVGTSGAPVLCSARRENLELAQTIATRLGIPTYAITASQRTGYGAAPTALYSLRFSRAALGPEFFLIAEHRRRFIASPGAHDRMRWRVESVEDAGEAEEVFCAVVPDTGSFALADFIWTHNCHQCRRTYDDVSGEPCAAAGGNGHLIGGPVRTRKRRSHDCYGTDCCQLSSGEAAALRAAASQQAAAAAQSEGRRAI